MSTPPHVPGLPGNELHSDDDAVFDDLARRAGAALRRPAPEDGVRRIAQRGRRQQALKATVVGAVVVASLIGGLAVVSSHDADRVDTVASTPARTPTASGEEISVTADSIQFGDGLVGDGRVAKADGRTYVVAGHFEEDPLHADEPTLGWFRPETAVLVAFDDAGVELWRSELDGVPEVAAVAGDVWLLDNGSSRVDGVGTLSRIDTSNGRVVDEVSIEGPVSMVGAFGSAWILTGAPVCVSVDCVDTSAQLIRVDPDLSTTTVELPDRVLSAEYVPQAFEDVTAGPDAIWVPLGEGGVAVIDPDTSEVTVVPVDDGHVGQRVAFHGDVAYVASQNRVTSIVDGEALATVSPGEGWNLASIDGFVGMLLSDGRFEVLGANDPMVVERRQTSAVVTTGSMYEIDGEAWVETGRNFDLRRLELVPVSSEDG